ncbi:hypothetical protein GCM10008910_20070 [Faecalicatena orotica]
MVYEIHGKITCPAGQKICYTMEIDKHCKYQSCGAFFEFRMPCIRAEDGKGVGEFEKEEV